LNDLLDLEARTTGDHQGELRLWLRLLTCSTMVEREVRRRLRVQFDVTLPRFDLMAQLERSPDGMILGELSQRMMVSNGNITGLVRLLVEHGLVATFTDPADRRATYVRLTAAGRANFAVMAAAHAGWIAAMFADLDADAMARLMDELGRLKRSAMQGNRNDV
jgi:DNA-binding MarR family transcriptional regulator